MLFKKEVLALLAPVLLQVHFVIPAVFLQAPGFSFNACDEDNIDEERRLAYVGITRAQTELSFILCKERRQFSGETVRPEPSRFLLELPQDDLQWENQAPQATAEQRQEKLRPGSPTYARCAEIKRVMYV